MTTHTPYTVCVCPYGRRSCPGASPSIAESHDGAVLSAGERRGIVRRVRYTPTTNYILKLVSSSSNVENSLEVRLSLPSAGLAYLNLTSRAGWVA